MCREHFQLQDIVTWGLQLWVPLLLIPNGEPTAILLPLLILALRRPTFEQIVQQLEDMAGQLEQLKQQQAQDMAAAAAPVYHSGTGHLDIGDLGHELTPSLLQDLMPSGFSAGSEHSGDEVQIADSGTLYEMSQLSTGSQDKELQREVQDLQQQQQQ